ncbi:shikimate kinase [Homoserinibacter sp. GY 40078]|uniref:shikimate kinase n=1 Tax=Homoserinibacter sp. GY 40078 TaxID=2603275 RepID=UPI0011CB5A56|nr:shikimate kinase [Homoserinibacter sp. GY 40078]TXK17536.1 shikimate kinase [Homoserinibacter sp. GY 40078]
MTGPRVVFVGPMGAGKTRLGKRVAASLGVPFVDTDRVIVTQHGPIAEIFDTHGEERFRALEREAVSEALQTAGVISLGGGAVLDAGTRADLAPLPVVWLTITPEAVAARLVGSGRPLVRDGGLEAWQRIAESRRPLYAEVADVEFDTSRRPIDHIARDIVAWLETEDR